MTVAAIIVAAGQGQRFGHAGKAFAVAAGHPLAWWSIQAALEAQTIDELVVVCAPHTLSAANSAARDAGSIKPISVVLGGSRRQDSALAGLQATSAEVEVVAIHDAARPLVTGALFDSVVQDAMRYGAAIAAIPVADTIKRVTNGFVLETVPRNDLIRVQTPQAFRKALLATAFAEAERDGLVVTDEATLIERSGQRVHVTAGLPENIKVTHPEELTLAEVLLQRFRR